MCDFFHQGCSALLQAANAVKGNKSDDKGSSACIIT